MLMGKYEMGRTLGEGHFGKVKLARHSETGQAFAIKILDRQRILAMKINEQIKREIATLKLLKHPNVVRLHEVTELPLFFPLRIRPCSFRFVLFEETLLGGGGRRRGWAVWVIASPGH
jgi:serine/threonine protein kinase